MFFHIIALAELSFPYVCFGETFLQEFTLAFHLCPLQWNVTSHGRFSKASFHFTSVHFRKTLLHVCAPAKRHPTQLTFQRTLSFPLQFNKPLSSLYCWESLGKPVDIKMKFQTEVTVKLRWQMTGVRAADPHTFLIMTPSLSTASSLPFVGFWVHLLGKSLSTKKASQGTYKTSLENRAAFMVKGLGLQKRTNSIFTRNQGEGLSGYQLPSQYWFNQDTGKRPAETEQDWTKTSCHYFLPLHDAEKVEKQSKMP